MPTIPGLVNLGWFSGSRTLFRAREPGRGRQVAVRLLGDALDGDVTRRRDLGIPVLRELAGHSHIPAVHAWGTTTRGDAYVVLELVEEESLADWVATFGRLPFVEVLDIATKIAGALAAAHEVGVVHGRLGPEHIVISQAGEPQLTGLDRSVLLNGAEAAARTTDDDVTALGATMFTLLSGVGRAPGAGDPAGMLGPLDIPAPITALIARCLSTDQGRRPPSMAAVVAQLRAIAAELGEQRAAPPRTTARPAAAAATSRGRSFRSNQLVAAAGLGVVLVVGGVAAGLARTAGGAPPAPGEGAQESPSASASAEPAPVARGLAGQTTLAVDLAGLVAAATPDVPPHAYVTASDDTETLSADLPADWADVDGRPSAITAGRGVADLRAGSDLEALHELTAPGIVVNRLTSLAPGETETVLLDDLRPSLSAACRYEGRRPYPSPAYDAQMDVYRGCGAAGTTVIVVSAIPSDRSSIVRVQLIATTTRDLEALDRVLDSVAHPPGGGSSVSAP